METWWTFLNVSGFLKTAHRIEIVGVGGKLRKLFLNGGRFKYFLTDLTLILTDFLYLTHNNITTIYNSKSNFKNPL
jgi:hypothetical protein